MLKYTMELVLKSYIYIELQNVNFVAFQEILQHGESKKFLEEHRISFFE